MIKRARITVDGPSIQQVRYRRTVVKLARKFGILGAVRNVDDGTVEIIGQGEEQQLLSFIKEIDIKEVKKGVQPTIQVGEVKWKDEPLAEEFTEFKISYLSMEEYLDNLTSDVEVAKDALFDVSSNQAKTLTSIDNLRGETQTNFNSMEFKYHRISILSVALLTTISSFAVYGSLVYLDVVPKTLEWFIPFFGFNVLIWAATGYLTSKKSHVRAITETEKTNNS